MPKLEGKVAVITGGSLGMARATAKLFVAEGAHVYITGRRQEQLDDAVADIGRNVTAVAGDVSNNASLDRLYDIVTREHGRVDVVFASAGVGDFTEALEQVTEATFARVFDINVRGTLFTVQKALPLMTSGGSIIINGSTLSRKGYAGATVISASKAALRSFARTWAAELKDRGIRVNIVHPGVIETASLDDISAAHLDYMRTVIPLGRFGRPEEIASTVLFFASEDSSYITGSELFVDGGRTQI